MRSFLPLQSLVLAMVLCCFLIPKSAAQSKLRTYLLQEISLDFSPWVQGNQGATLLLRSNLGKPSGQKWGKQNVLRGLFGFVQIPPPSELRIDGFSRTLAWSGNCKENGFRFILAGMWAIGRAKERPV
jgi:hypothetical protein